jgi:hypothetical protein
VPVPFWVKTALDRWLMAAAISEGAIFRRVSRTGSVWGPRISEKLVWWIARQRTEVAGIDRLAPHEKVVRAIRKSTSGLVSVQQSEIVE